MTDLSILIPSIPERSTRLNELFAIYEDASSRHGLNVEILSIIDNKRMSVGTKRNKLVDMAQSKYWVMTDDDADYLTEAYFQNIKDALSKDVDVVTYMQSASINEESAIVNFGLCNSIEEFVNGKTILRPAWHCCTWKKEAVLGARFSDVNWGEDDPFARAANELAKSEYHINQICHVYQHNSQTTAAFQ